MIGRERFGGKLPSNKSSQPQPTAKVNTKQESKRNTPQIVKTELVTCACGHQTEFKHFPDRQDKFRDQRREKLMRQTCSACRQQAHKELIARQQAEAAERKKIKAKQKNMEERLPHGARFIMTYSEKPEPTWTGSLTIPDASGGIAEKTFTATTGGVRRLEEKLSKMYREWAKEQGKGK